MDPEYHQWLFIEGVIYLSYSYMTFVLNQEMIRDEGTDFIKPGYLFDEEQYNYTISGMSSLTDEKTIKNTRKLKYILDQLYAKNSKSIELL